MDDRYHALVAERTARARNRLLATHPCSILCGDGVHVDLTYVTPEYVALAGDRLAVEIKRRYEWLHEVMVLDVRPVEAPPPDPRAAQCPLAGSGRVDDIAAATFGVWWTIPGG